MAASREDVRAWFDEGVRQGATHMIVACDTFDYEDFPTYVMPGENVREKAAPYQRGENMTRLMEVYCLGLGREEQLAERRAFHWEDAPLKPKTKICNWCAQVAELHAAGWRHAILSIEGLTDGSISWLPERALDFCDEKECQDQLRRAKQFLLEVGGCRLPAEGEPKTTQTATAWVHLVTFRSEIDGEKLESDVRVSMYVEDVLALARFYNEASHPKLRSKLEAFRDENES